MTWRFKACDRCGGDLTMDDGEWRCWQCGHIYFPPRRLDPLLRFDPAAIQSTDETGTDETGNKRRRRSTGPRKINTVIQVSERNAEKWWARNREIGDFSVAGPSVKEISHLIGRHATHVRSVKDELSEMRQASQTLSV